eukprot:CAMPEP_0183740082 /NCGR_PEP_ID=MMETSP0737-20130205/58766_1 /TAXON_ID=385413 /ORGANISM="Thalassiosira miniscula, Strain CCMP1093" /LENGTH=448 /DNA_ID=CAMNT_0025975067 /DNA_START=118 /DNA_END=1464 /DNA_ORIENTATION=-
MVSRPIIFSLMAGVAAAASSPSSPQRHLRSASASSSPDIPDISEKRRSLQDDEDITVEIPPSCLNLLKASADKNGNIPKDNYFVFTDGMSNGYLSANGMTEYGDMPTENKFAFVTLSCQCVAFGGRSNCCQGNRAKLAVPGLDDPTTMPDQVRDYVMDICSTTSDAIGDNKMPPSGELPITNSPTTASPTSSPTTSPTKNPTKAPATGTTESSADTANPTGSPIRVPPAVVKPPGQGPPSDDDPEGGLSGGAIAGIVMAGACVLTLMMYLLSDREKEEKSEDQDLEEMARQDTGKELLTIDAGAAVGSDCVPRAPSPDATQSMTASDMSSLPSLGTSRNNQSAYYANNSLLPGRPEDDSMLTSSDGPSFFTENEIAEGIEVTSPRGSMSGFNNSTILHDSNVSTSGSEMTFDQAIESGNWEAVAASAAAMVKNSDSSSASSLGETSLD